MEVSQLHDIEALIAETEKAKKMFREQKRQKEQVNKIIQQQAAPIVKAIEASKPKEIDPSDIVNISDFKKKAEIVYSTNYDLGPNNFKQLMVDFKNNGYLPVLITLINLGFNPNITLGNYKKYGWDLLTFYGFGGKNVNQDFVRFTKREDVRKYTSFINSFVMANGKAAEEFLQSKQKVDDTIIESDDDISSEKGDENDIDSEKEDEEHEGSGLQLYRNVEDLVKKLMMLHATWAAGNKSTSVFNDAQEIASELLKIGKITKDKYLEIAKLFSN